jgi:hypothetical protein
MALNRESREVRKVKAVLYSRLALKHKLDRIDYQFDTVDPVVEAVLAGRAVPELNIPAGYLFDIQVELEDPTPGAQEG